MKKYYFIILTFLCFGATQVSGQLKQFDLKSYKQPELNRLQLDFRLSQNSNATVPADDSYGERDGIKRKSSFNFNGEGGFSWYRNSAKHQGLTRTSMYYNPQSETVKFEEDDWDDTKLKKRNLGISVNSENYFYDANNWFISPNLDFDYSKNKTDGEDYNSGNGRINYDNTKHSNTHLKASIMAGKGRIERVEDARQVLYILDALDKEGRLTRIPSDEEILQIARRISELKNERFFDSRHKRMNEIREMDALLKEMDLIKEEDALYYTNLYDMWQHGANEQRLSGTRFSAGLSPLLNQNKYESDDFEYKQKVSGILGVVRFDYENPFHLKWQSSLFSELSYGTAQGEKEDTNYGMTYSENYNYNNYYNSYATIDKNEMEYDHINATFGYTMGFYPNTRTSAKAEARLTHQSYKGSLEEENVSTDFDYNDFQGQLALSLNYYISPQVRLNCRTGIVYSDIESDRLRYWNLNQLYTSNKWFNYFEVNLQFSIF